MLLKRETRRKPAKFTGQLLAAIFLFCGNSIVPLEILVERKCDVTVDAFVDLVFVFALNVYPQRGRMIRSVRALVTIVNATFVFCRNVYVKADLKCGRIHAHITMELH